MLKRFLLTAIAAAGLGLAAALAACGDDGQSPASGTAGAPAPPPINTRTGNPSPAGTAFSPIEGTVPAQGFGGTEPVTVKSDPDPMPGIAILVDVRVGAHPEQGGWDRIVFEFRGGLPPGDVRYSTRQPAQCGSGLPVTVPGATHMFVRFSQTNAHTEAGQPSLQRREIRGPGGAIVEAEQTCDFEAVVEWAVGVDAPERFNVRKLANPPRLVIDIKQ